MAMLWSMTSRPRRAQLGMPQGWLHRQLRQRRQSRRAVQPHVHSRSRSRSGLRLCVLLLRLRVLLLRLRVLLLSARAPSASPHQRTFRARPAALAELSRRSSRGRRP